MLGVDVLEALDGDFEVEVVEVSEAVADLAVVVHGVGVNASGPSQAGCAQQHKTQQEFACATRLFAQSGHSPTLTDGAGG